MAATRSFALRQGGFSGAETESGLPAAPRSIKMSTYLTSAQKEPADRFRLCVRQRSRPGGDPRHMVRLLSRWRYPIDTFGLQLADRDGRGIAAGLLGGRLEFAERGVGDAVGVEFECGRVLGVEPFDQVL